MSINPIPILQPRIVYGLRTDIDGNANFITDEEILYPVGGLLTINNFVQKRQRFMKLPDRGVNVTAILLSPNQKIIAMAEKGERPCINLYDAQTFKKKRQIQAPVDKETMATSFACLQFTFDTKSLITVTGAPDYNLYAFKSDKAKLESSVKGNNMNGTGTVNEVACNPNDANLIAIVGLSVFKIMACTDAVWRQYGYNKSDNLNLTCAAWLSQDRLLAGTAEGKFMIFESGDLKKIVWVGDLFLLNLKQSEKEEMQVSSQTNISEPSAGSIHSGEDYRIRCLIVFPKGFAFAYLNGLVHLFEKEGPHKYKKRNLFKVPNQIIIREEADVDLILNEIKFLCINPSQDRLVVTCKQNQLYTVRLWGQDLLASPEILFQEFGPSLHHGAIGGVDICSWKPIFITSGEWDRSLRIWNYETETLELCKHFQEDIRDVALHPMGLYTVVGFSDKLRFLTIMIDDFICIREFPIRNCRNCSFSQSGKFFAAVNGNLIQVYITITFDNVFNLKGHNGKVPSLSWTANDYKMTSCGTEGAVYEWDIITQKRIEETIIKSCSFTSVATTSSGKFNYAVGSDGYIREIVKSDVHKEIMVYQEGLDNIALANSDQFLFISSNNGLITSLNLPLVDNFEYLEFAGHLTTVSHMAIAHDDSFLITCSTDGVICVWKILNVEGRTAVVDKDFVSSTNILIARSDLEDKLTTIKDLQLRQHELLTEHSYQMRNMEVLHSLKLKEVHEGYCLAIEDLKEKNENLETEHAQELSNMTVEMNTQRANHEEFVQKLEVSYNDKLIVEYDKYLLLEDKLSNLRKRYEKELEELTRAKEESEETITNDFLQQLHEKEVQLDELMEETKAKTKEHELIKQQIEDDADREIYELKAIHERDIKEEQDNNVRLKGETGIIRKKLLSAQKEIEELNHIVYTMQSEHVKFKGVIIGLEKDIMDLKKEITERDATIQDKEIRIHELKRKNQELEKFKLILDFKIKELKSQIEPRDLRIREQATQVNDMVNELENLQKIVMNLDIQLEELKERLTAADNELKREVVKNRAAKAALKMIRTDIHHISGLMQDVPKLKRAIKAAYHKYNADKDFEITQAEDAEAKNEFLRQRDFLEKTVRTLQQQVVKYSTSSGSDKIRLVEENSSLITETNILRKTLKSEVSQKKKMEAVLGISSKYMVAKNAQKVLNDAVATTEEIHEEYKQKLEDDQNAILALRDENHRLTSKIINECGENQDETSTTSSSKEEK